MASQQINSAAQTGSGVGATIGGLLGGPLGTALGSGLGQAGLGVINAIPKLADTQLDTDNKRRLAELKRRQELGTLGLSEQEKQALSTNLLAPAQAQLQQGQNIQRQMLTGAGQEQLRNQVAAESNAQIAGQASAGVQAQNLAEKQLQLEEKNALTAAVSDREAEKSAAIAAIATGGLSTFIESYGQEEMIQGKQPTMAEASALAKVYGITPEEGMGMATFVTKNPDALKYFEILNKSKG